MIGRSQCSVSLDEKVAKTSLARALQPRYRGAVAHLSLRSLLSLLLALTLAGCNKPAEETVESDAPAPAGQAAAPEAGARTSSSSLATGLSAEGADATAPEGVFYLVSKVTISTENGVTGVPPGTRLQEVGPGQYIDLEGRTLKLEPKQVTKSVRIARQVGSTDRSMQSSLQQSRVRVGTASSASMTQPTATPLASLSARQPMQTQPTSGASLGNRPTFGSGGLSSVHSSDRERVKRDESGKRYYTDRGGRRHYLD